MTFLQAIQGAHAGPTLFQRHLAVHMANAELRHEHAFGSLRPPRPRWSRRLMAVALSVVIGALVGWRVFLA